MAKLHDTKIDEDGFARFTLLGGAYNRLALHVAKQFGFRSALAFGISLSVLFWLILALLVILEGYSQKFFSIEPLAIHARMLCAVPLLLWGGHLFDRAIGDACSSLVKVGIVTGSAKIALDKQAARLARLINSWQLSLGLMVAVVAFGISTPPEYLPGVSGFTGNLTEASNSLAGHWYGMVCLPAFRFVLVRFVCLMCMWTFLIWRLSRQDLALNACHPDRAGGLGLLVDAQTQLLTLVFAASVVDAAALAETSVVAELTKQDVYLHVFLLTLGGSVAVCAPLLLLTSSLFKCRREAMIEFGLLGQKYSALFRQRWIDPDPSDYRDFLGSGDIQSLADLSGSYDNVNTMRVLPVTRTLLLMIFGCATGPHLPLLLLEYPISELLIDLVKTLIGS